MTPKLPPLSILGATGRFGAAISEGIIGLRTAGIDGRIAAISAATNIDRLVALSERLEPQFAALADATGFRHLRDRLRGSATVPGAGDEALRAAARLPSTRLLIALPGSAALAPLADGMAPGRIVLLSDPTAIALAWPSLAVESTSTVRPLHPQLSPLLLSLLAEPQTDNAAPLVLPVAAGTLPLDHLPLIAAAATLLPSRPLHFTQADALPHWPATALAALALGQSPPVDCVPRRTLPSAPLDGLAAQEAAFLAAFGRSQSSGWGPLLAAAEVLAALLPGRDHERLRQLARFAATLQPDAPPATLTETIARDFTARARAYDVFGDLALPH